MDPYTIPPSAAGAGAGAGAGGGGGPGVGVVIVAAGDRKEEEPLLVCDVQGVGFNYTDPTICTTGRGGVYGKSDIGKKGIDNFFRTHKCNAYCVRLGLPEHSTLPSQQQH
jgi:hypothetical protein